MTLLNKNLNHFGAEAKYISQGLGRMMRACQQEFSESNSVELVKAESLLAQGLESALEKLARVAERGFKDVNENLKID